MCKLNSFRVWLVLLLLLLNIFCGVGFLTYFDVFLSRTLSNPLQPNTYISAFTFLGWCCCADSYFISGKRAFTTGSQSPHNPRFVVERRGALRENQVKRRNHKQNNFPLNLFLDHTPLHNTILKFRNESPKSSDSPTIMQSWIISTI